MESQKDNEAPVSSEGAKVGRITRTVTLLVSYATKITGLVFAVNEILGRASARSSVIALSAFMMAGAQLSQSAIMAALDRLLGGEQQPQAAAKTHKGDQ